MLVVGIPDMARDTGAPGERTPREVIQFYLLDHRTVLGKAIDVTLLGLNLVFVGIFIVETYPIAADLRALLWTLEVGIASVFAVEYVARLYGAADRKAEFLNRYTMIDLVSVVPTLLTFAFPVSSTALQVGFLRAIRIVRRQVGDGRLDSGCHRRHPTAGK